MGDRHDEYYYKMRSDPKWMERRRQMQKVWRNAHREEVNAKRRKIIEEIKANSTPELPNGLQNS